MEDLWSQFDQEIYTISRLNREARELLESHLSHLWIEGEISNFKRAASGHMYFTLKDENSEIDAAMFSHLNSRLDFEPEDGMSVLAYGTLTIYEPRGRYQIVLREMLPAGVGKLQLQFEQLKAKLQQEGLFDEAHKRGTPPSPERIGIVTSATGAAVRDIVSILSRRYPPVAVYLFPVRVQGEGAAEEIAAAIRSANRYSETVEPIDLLIVGRGGGSLEDLWAFNEEVVARAIFDSNVPIISAVGHEIDFTIADFVADLRAPTPSAAAEWAVPDRNELITRVNELLLGAIRSQQGRVQDLSRELDVLLSRYAFRYPLRRVREADQTLDRLTEMLIRAIASRWRDRRGRFENLVQRLELANPAAILRRGYAVVESEATGAIVKRMDQVDIGDRVRVRLHRGGLVCEVEGVIEADGYRGDQGGAGTDPARRDCERAGE
ncbi:MAG: exodeoxyribonuclease VII large subunit [Candidatus Bipolaricaulia bacterium]